MNKIAKGSIVAALIVATAIVIVLKQKEAKQTPDLPSAGTSESTVSTENTSDDSQTSPEAKKLPTLLDLGADKCIPCKAMAPILENLREEYHDTMNVEFIDVWKHPDQAKPYNLKMIPTQIFLDADGNELFRHEGFYSKEDILKKWNEFGVVLETEVQ